jgi:S-adenosylmethionine decarboxylase
MQEKNAPRSRGAALAGRARRRSPTLERAPTRRRRRARRRVAGRASRERAERRRAARGACTSGRGGGAKWRSDRVFFLQSLFRDPTVNSVFRRAAKIFRRRSSDANVRRRRRRAVDDRDERRPARLNALGRHLLLELFDCDLDAINNVETVKGALVEAAKRAQATIVDVVFHEFNPFGVSGVVVIAESHLSIHTWPEYRYAAVDIFSCGDVLQPEIAANYLVEQFGAERTSVVEMQRGMFLGATAPIVNKAAVAVS